MIGWFREQWSKHTPETAFLLLAVVFGLLFVFVVPPTQAADETTHFYRAYQLSEGHVLSTKIEQGYGAYLPAAVYNNSRQLYGDIPSHYERLFNYRQLPGLLKQKIDPRQRVPVHLEGSTVYSPVAYIPQIIAITLAKIVWPSTLLMYYIGRLANLVVWIGLMYLAIRLWPYNKWPIFALALIPMSLSQGATNSPDALTNSLAFLTIATAFYYAKRRVQLTNKQLALFIVMLVLLALCKPVFFVIGLLALILNYKQLGSKRRYWLFAALAVGLALVVTAIWNSLVSSYSVAIQHYYYPAPNVDKVQQALHILKHPLDFAYTLGRSYLSSNGDLLARTYVGRLGWWDIDMPLWLTSSIYALIAFAILNRQPDETAFAKRQRIISAIVFAGGFVAISATLYLTITPVGAHYITGNQGRYFIPFTPLLIPIFGGLLKVQDWKKQAAWIFPVAYSIILTSSLVILVSRFV